MARAGEDVTIDGVTARYSKRELAALRDLTTAPCAPAVAWAVIGFIHAVKFQFEAVIVDEVEEASIRRGWDAAEAADNSARGQAVPA